MTIEKKNPVSGETRRSFIKRTTGAAAALAGSEFLIPVAHAAKGSEKVVIVSEPGDDLVKEGPVQWAIERLCGNLEAKAVNAEVMGSVDNVPAGAVAILVAGRETKSARSILSGAQLSVPDVPEALGIVSGELGGRRLLLVSGSDVRGLVYGVLELADRVCYGENPIAELSRPDRIVERPANRIRSIGRLFTSDVEDKAWFYDKAFWKEYLSMLIEQRINRFNMTLGIGYNAPRRIKDSYFYFPYPFLLDVPGYNVKADGLPDAERDRNLEMLKYIAEETKRRGLHFQLALWTHAYEFKDSPDVNYTISGLTPDNHVEYCRDALQLLIETIPKIDGVTFSCHSDSGIPGGS